MTEFEIIKDFFKSQSLQRQDVRVGIGDDTAIVNPPLNQQLAITTDTLTAGVHFPMATPAFAIGHKSLAVNLSDLAAMGASPAWATLAITLPEADPNWIKAFCDGFFTLANAHHIQLIGGDLTKGPLSITVQAVGFVKPDEVILRSGAKPQDKIYLTGTLGDAGLALKNLANHKSMPAALLNRLNQPTPHIAVGERLGKLASAAIDISDGLTADLSHILEASKTGAKIEVEKIPLSSWVGDLPSEEGIELALTSGDDYELCFTVPPQQEKNLLAMFANQATRLTCIGEITAQPGLILQKNGKNYASPTTGYQHF